MKLYNSIAAFSAFFLINFYRADGRVLELDERFLSAQSEGSWLVMFYAPWCGHCKNLEPTWVDVGASLLQANSKVNVARLDATKYSSVASRYQVRGFPTIKFFKQGQPIEYNGGRSKQSIISFVNKAQGPEVTEFNNQQTFVDAKSKHDVFFVYVGDKDTQLHKMYIKVARVLFTSISFYSAPSTNILGDVSTSTVTTVLVFKDGKYYEIPEKMRNNELVGTWVKAEQFPTYNHLTGQTYHTLRASGRRFAIAVLSQKNDAFDETMNRIALGRTHSYTFCWVAGSDIVNKMTYSVVSVPNLVVYDTATHEYFVMRSDERQSELTDGNIGKFFADITDGSIPAMGGRGVKEQAKRAFGDFTGFVIEMFTNHPIVSSIVVFLPTLLITGFCYCLCTMTDDAHSEYDEDSEDEGEFERTEKDGEMGIEGGDEAVPTFMHDDYGDSPASEGVRRRVVQSAKDAE